MLLDYIIQTGLGFKNIYYDNKILEEIPSTSFGVFVSVKRSSFQKIKTWPDDIHGCIGYWNNDFSIMNKKTLLVNAIRVSYDATWKDLRRKYFNIPIYKDSHALYEIDFMMDPVYSVNIENGLLSNGEYFNNKEYGLIVTGNTRATYLPNVFPNKKWEFIKNSLIKKGSVSGNYKLYAYKVLLLSKKLYKIFNNTFFDITRQKMYSFFTKYYKKNIPYSVLENNSIEYDKTQYVRNIATIHDILQIGIVDTPLKNKIVNELKEYKKIYNKNKESLRQASSFLILAYSKLHIEKKTSQSICSYLYESIHNLEPKFELGEVLISLTHICPDKKILLQKQKEMYNLLFTTNHNSNSIFQYNWESKFLYSLYISNIHKNSNNSIFHNHVDELYSRIKKICLNYNQTTETNYIAVSFEALCSLYTMLQKLHHIECIDIIFSLFYFLQLRKEENGLYYFLNKTARLDISGHVWNGFIALLQ